MEKEIKERTKAVLDFFQLISIRSSSMSAKMK